MISKINNSDLEQHKFGFFNSYLLKLKDKVRNDSVKKILEYGVYGGMTGPEQIGYFKNDAEALKGSRYNMVFDFSLNAVIGVVPLASDLLLKNFSSYDADYGLGAALIVVGSSAVVNLGRWVYSSITKKPIESFSSLSLLGNSTSYFRDFKGVSFVLRANHPDMFEEFDIYLKPVDQGFVFSENRCSKEEISLEELCANHQ